MDRYAVIGNPVSHSKSPQIHQAFATQTGQPIRYEKLLAEAETFEQTLCDFHTAGGKGVNVTLPFKELAFKLCAETSDYARSARAVNTILFKSAQCWIGTNTDGIGLVQDLKKNLRVNIYGRRVLIMGAGGSVRGILLPLINEGAEQITIANRTVSRALQLGKEFGVTGCGYDALDGQQFDLIINASSAGLLHQMPSIPHTILSRECVCYDLVYADTDTRFVEWAKNHAAVIAADGLGMLIEQAAASFYFWRNVRPDTQPVFSLLRP